LDKTETKLWADRNWENVLIKMLENGSVNSETKDCPIRPMLKTTKNIDTQEVRLLCTYFSSPNPAT